MKTKTINTIKKLPPRSADTCASYLNPVKLMFLAFWKLFQDIYPRLAKMAMNFLVIPETSSPSEGVFSKTKIILGPQRASLASLNVEALLCLKDWYRLFVPLYVSEHDVQVELSSD